MIVIMELLWFFTFLLTGLSIDVALYSLFNAHEFSWNLYEMKALQEMWFLGTTAFCLLYVALRYYRTKLIANHFLLQQGPDIEYVDNRLCERNVDIADVRKLIVSAAKEKGLPQTPIFAISQSDRVRITSCHVRLLSPPIIVISSAAINGLNGRELRWLIATEISRLYRGSSSLYYKNKTMFVSSSLYFMFIGIFQSLWTFGKVAEQANTGGGFARGQGGCALIMGLFILSILVGYGLIILIPMALLISLLTAFLCRRWPDKRYAKKQIKKLVAKEDLKPFIKRMKILLKGKKPFASDEIYGIRWSPVCATPTLRWFHNNAPQELLSTIQPGRRYYFRHLSRIIIGGYTAFFLFSYPLFDLYQVSFPTEFVKKHIIREDIMSWNPTYRVEFTYDGEPSKVDFTLTDKHLADVSIKLGKDERYTGIAINQGGCDQGATWVPAENRFVACRISLVDHINIDEKYDMSERKRKHIERTATKVLNTKLRRTQYMLGERDGFAIYNSWYQPIVKIIPRDFSDLSRWFIKLLGPEKL